MPVFEKVKEHIESMTLFGLREAAHAGDPWYTRLEMVDGVKHDKFWEAWAIGGGSAFVRYGRRGAEGNTLIKNLKYVKKKLPEKIRKGYNYVSHTREMEFEREVVGPLLALIPETVVTEPALTLPEDAFPPTPSSAPGPLPRVYTSSVRRGGHAEAFVKTQEEKGQVMVIDDSGTSSKPSFVPYTGPELEKKKKVGKARMTFKELSQLRKKESDW